MTFFSLIKNILISYRMYFRLIRKTFFNTRGTQARLTFRRFMIMLIFSVLLFLLKTMHWIFYIADEIFFRGYKKVEVNAPLFIVGVPRSGTTFLHRFLAEDKKNFTTFSLWELIIAPSVTQRKIVRFLASADLFVGSPLKKCIGFLERKAFGSLDDVHMISFSDPEEDYFFLAPVYACFLMILPFPFPEDLGYLAFFDDETPDKDKERIMAFYKTCLQRHLYVHGHDKTILSKNVSFGPMIRTLSHSFQDAKIIATVRNPLEAVPSHISAMMEGAAIFDNDVKGDVFRDQMIDVQRYAYSHLARELPLLSEEKQLTVKMEDLKKNLFYTIRSIYQRFGFSMNSSFETYLRDEDDRQKHYRSSHIYDMTSYRLSHQDIYSRFSDVFQKYNYASTTVKG